VPNPTDACIFTLGVVPDVDEPARHVWTMAGNSSINNTYAVPAGQMLVIQEVSSLCGASEWRIGIDESSVANCGVFYFAAGNGGEVPSGSICPVIFTARHRPVEPYEADSVPGSQLTHKPEAH